MAWKEIEVHGWHTPAEMPSVGFCPVDIELFLMVLLESKLCKDF